MSQLSTSILELKSDFIREALDVGQVYLTWTGRHLQEGRLEEAVVSFTQFIRAVRAAALEMKAIRAALEDQKRAAEAATEWRAQQGTTV